MISVEFSSVSMPLRTLSKEIFYGSEIGADEAWLLGIVSHSGDAVKLFLATV